MAVSSGLYMYKLQIIKHGKDCFDNAGDQVQELYIDQSGPAADLNRPDDDMGGSASGHWRPGLKISVPVNTVQVIKGRFESLQH